MMLQWSPGYKPEPRVEFQGFTTARGDLLLDIHVNGEHRYRLGPFDNREQRMAVVDRLRSVLGIRSLRHREKTTMGSKR
jgi:hypothetical protein